MVKVGCILAVMVTSVIAACAGGNDAPPLDGTPVALLDYVTTAPAGWQPHPPGSSMRLAEFRVPGQHGESTAEVVVFFFGPDQGGSVEANIERWTQQFSLDDGSRPQPAIARETGTAFPTTIVQLRGNYARSIGMADTSAVPKPDQTLLAAVVETPSGNLHIQMHGEAGIVSEHEAGFRAFVRGVRAHTGG